MNELGSSTDASLAEGRMIPRSLIAFQSFQLTKLLAHFVLAAAICNKYPFSAVCTRALLRLL